MMASQTGCEIMNGEDRGFDPHRHSRKKRLKEFSNVQEPVKQNHVYRNNDVSSTIDRCKLLEYRKVVLDTGCLVGVPDIIREICQV